ncbi:hypothetical protein VNO78_20274 [Psophocarpus tetragonolobus]|uniref:Uncharacterized protein n=1 Tax=Psophocarpus tetragonolobus TaxID=3891 RepID=A0AAN9XH21_PSOTE
MKDLNVGGIISFRYIAQYLPCPCRTPCNLGFFEYTASCLSLYIFFRLISPSLSTKVDLFNSGTCRAVITFVFCFFTCLSI